MLNLCFSQEKNSEIKVDYKEYCDTDVPVVLPTTLWIKNNSSIYQEKFSIVERWVEKPSAIQINAEKFKSNYEPYLKVDRNKKEILFFAPVGKSTFLIKDTYTDLPWVITQETKQIAGYSCTKATTKFRGREWIAWFTSEIPLPFGPWKLNGLPGLILEASDTTNKYTFLATNIENVESGLFEKDFSAMMPIKTKTPMPIREYIESNEEYSDNFDKLLKNNKEFQIGEIKKEPRSGEELIYEWEQ